jgi:NAD(P)-dependent dehydrogenase (short-subunit alcohol dehydrogenase family)
MGLLEGRVAVVTGGGRGIGQAIAIECAGEGADVVLAARSKDGLDATARRVRDAGREALVVPTDIADPRQVEELAAATLDRFGRVDLLVNNSGVGGPTAPLWKVSEADWEATFAVNVTGTYRCCRAFLPSMIERGSGSIVVIGSMTGKRHLVNRTPYAASKTALIGLVRTLAWEVGPYDIRVNLVSPGPVSGERIEWVIAAQAEARGISEDEARQAFTSASPLGRLVPPSDVAKAVVFLASDRAASITGEDLNVAAGVVMY